MAIRLYKSNGYLTTNDSGIGANSLDTTWGAFFVSKVSGIVDKATNAVGIVWVNVTESIYASDNQTVALKWVNFTPANNNRLYEVAITGGTVTIVDEQKYYNLTASGWDTVDGTTETTIKSYVNTSDAGGAVDPVIKMQLQLVKFVTATKSIFRIVI